VPLIWKVFKYTTPAAQSLVCRLTRKRDGVIYRTLVSLIKYTLLPRHQNAGQYQDIKIGNRYFENVAQFTYLGTTITNQNPIQEEIEFQ
jgi:hypothetical protein